MRIIIRAIEAKIIDVSTPEDTDFIISEWIVKYEATIYYPKDISPHTVQGSLPWRESVIIKDIMQAIKDCYV